MVSSISSIKVIKFAAFSGVIDIFMMVNMSQNDEAIDGVWAGLFWLLDTFENNAENSEIKEIQK